MVFRATEIIKLLFH